MISRITGWLSRCYLPRFLREPFLKGICRMLRINWQEAENPLRDYPTINALFVRSLKPELRPVDPAPAAVVSPVDGTILEFGAIRDHRLLQAKGRYYDLRDLLPADAADHFKNGSFITIYLSPSDCHRIFSPVDGNVTAAWFTPGALYPVREPHISQTENLYVENERLTTLFTTTAGHVAVVKVAAVNVSCITTQYDETLRSTAKKRTAITKSYEVPIPFKKGDWLATFHLGSTVILLWENGEFIPTLTRGASVRYGQKLGVLKGA